MDEELRAIQPKLIAADLRLRQRTQEAMLNHAAFKNLDDDLWPLMPWSTHQLSDSGLQMVGEAAVCRGLHMEWQALVRKRAAIHHQQQHQPQPQQQPSPTTKAAAATTPAAAVATVANAEIPTIPKAPRASAGADNPPPAGPRPRSADVAPAAATSSAAAVGAPPSFFREIVRSVRAPPTPQEDRDMATQAKVSLVECLEALRYAHAACESASLSTVRSSSLLVVRLRAGCC